MWRRDACVLLLALAALLSAASASLEAAAAGATHADELVRQLRQRPAGAHAPENRRRLLQTASADGAAGPVAAAKPGNPAAAAPAPGAKEQQQEPPPAKEPQQQQEQQPPPCPEFAWLEQHIATRCFAAPAAVWQLDDGAGSTREMELERTTEFFGITRAGAESFYYYYATTTRQLEYVVDGNGTRSLAGQPTRNVAVYRCQYGVRRSTGAVHGICYPSDASGAPMARADAPWPFTVHAASLRLVSNTSLQQTYDTNGPYEDLMAATASGVRPGRQEALAMYTLQAAHPSGPPAAAAGGGGGGSGDDAPATISSSTTTGQQQQQRAVAVMATTISVFNVDPVTGEREFVGTQEPVLEREVACSA